MTGVAVDELPTPVAVVDRGALDGNLARLARAAAGAGLVVRPHVKTHKCPRIAELQVEHGAVGFATATLDEAEALADAGFHDVVVCYPAVDPHRIARLVALAARPRARLTATVEDEAGARLLDAAARRAGLRLAVRVEVDTGLGRIGVELGEPLERLVAAVRDCDGLAFDGILTHEGWAYRMTDPGQRAEAVAERVQAFADAGRALGCPVVSSGATPAIEGALAVSGLTELRPGNYAILDAMQVALGVAAPEQCALSVVTTVISVRPNGRAIVDAGSKALTSDVGVHGLELASGHGFVVGRPDLAVTGLSEEHGWLQASGDGPPLRVGERLAIVPAHACATISASAELVLARDGVVEEVAPVVARGHPLPPGPWKP